MLRRGAVRLNSQIRSLFTDGSLSLDKFDLARRTRKTFLIKSVTRNPSECWSRTDDLLSGKMYVYSDDLQNALALAETAEHLEKIKQLCYRYHRQSKELKVFLFSLGPQVMRLYHLLKEPQRAYDAIMDVKLEDFFDSYACYQVSMDLLFKCGRHQEVIDVQQRYWTRPMKKFLKSCQILTIGSCYKLDTKDSYQFALNYAQNCIASGMLLTRRALAFLVALAINRKEVDMAVELMQMDVDPEAQLAMRCLRAKALTKVGRLDELLMLLEAMAKVDLPEQSHQEREITRDVAKSIEEAAKECSSDELKAKLLRTLNRLVRGRHIVDVSLDDILCAPVESVPANMPVSSLQGSLVNMWRESAHQSGMKVEKNYQFDPEATEKEIRVKREFLNAVGEHIRDSGPFNVDSDEKKAD